MKEKILITGYNGSLAKRLVHFLNDNYSLVFLSSSKKSVNNKDVFYWNIEEGYIDESALIGDPDTIVLRIKTLEKMGFEYLNILLPDDSKSLDLFAKEVMPEFSANTKKRAPSTQPAMMAE